MRHFAKEAKLQASNRLPQRPPYLSYWYDPIMHTLVGLHVGLDLHRCDGKYHVIRSSMREIRRPAHVVASFSDQARRLCSRMARRVRGSAEIRSKGRKVALETVLAKQSSASRFS